MSRLRAGPEESAAVLVGTGVASDYAETLLASLGVRVERRAGPLDPHPAALWADGGALSLTGHAHGAPRLAPGPLAACAVGAVRALGAMAPKTALPANPARLLGERGALTGATRRGRIAPGESCRLLPCADGWIAANLARPDDRRAVPAWLESAPLPTESVWEHAARSMTPRPAPHRPGSASRSSARRCRALHGGALSWSTSRASGRAPWRRRCCGLGVRG